MPTSWLYTPTEAAWLNDVAAGWVPDPPPCDQCGERPDRADLFCPACGEPVRNPHDPGLLDRQAEALAAEEYGCDCVLPEQSCPECQTKAAEAAGPLDEIY